MMRIKEAFMKYRLIAENALVRIRSFLPEDAAWIFAYSQEESTRRELPDEVFDSLEETEENLSAFNRLSAARAYPLVFCVADPKSDLPLGHVSLSPLRKNAVEIGYAIGEKHQGKGYGGAAAALFTRWALSAGGLDTLYGVVKESNPASVQCLEKAGYTLIRREERDCFGGRYMIREYKIDA